MCRRFVWFDIVGGRILIPVPSNVISRMQAFLGISHTCGWSDCGMLGLSFCIYLFDSQSSAIPCARVPCDIFRDSANLFMLTPVVWYVALVSSLFPRVMRSMKASSSACIHPHSKMVSSVRPLLSGFPENIGLKSSRDRWRFLNLIMTCSLVSVLAAILFFMGSNLPESLP